jgi:NADH:ubiquinone oxidoreductase subunit F (NADH-binding)
VICNASEGDPGVYHNKLLLESDPHSVLEGMLIAGYAVGAEQGYVYCPAAYELALERLRTALRQMEEYGLLGEGILGSSFCFQIKVKEGAGAYVCGEESAEIEWIEGKRGLPRLRPPFPPVSGLWARSTVVNNVETLVGAALVLQHGAEWFAQVGTENNRGTKVLCLSGHVQRSGVIEVPLGTTLAEIVEAIGGGAAGGRRLKAVHCGGPGGGCLPPRCLETPVDHDSLLSLGASLGSGGVVVMDETVCMVDIAHNALEFAFRESCGQCVPCRLGTKQMFDVWRDITEGRGRPDDLELLVELAEGMRGGSLCGHGQTAANPLLSILRYFRDECEAHLTYARCPAGVCSLGSSMEKTPCNPFR